MWADPLAWFPWIKVAAFILGMVVGGFAVSSTSWVWWRKQLITVAAGWLATLGTGLIGMSIWQSIQIEGGGFRAKLGHIEAQIRDTREELNRTTESVTSAKNDIILEVSQLREQANQILEVSSRTFTESPVWTGIPVEGYTWEFEDIAKFKELTPAAKQLVFTNEDDALKALTGSGYDADEAQTIIETIMKPPAPQQ